MNKKRLQVILNDEAWAVVETITNEANNNFETGTINYSDVINEMILSSKVDLKALQLKHTDLRRSLRVMASKDEIDLDSIIKALTELRSKSNGRKVQKGEEAVNG